MDVLVPRTSPAIKRPASIALVAEENRAEENERFRLTIERVAEEWLCPITHELPWDPVIAEDSRFYERGSIEEWFKRNEAVVRSPVTGVPMGRVLTASPQVRNTIERLIESGAITGDQAKTWKIRRAEEKEVQRLRQLAAAGKVQAMRTLGVKNARGKKGLPKDKAQAFSWWKLAADLGDVKAMALAGLLYCYGQGVTSNINRGTVCLAQAAALGSDMA
jgi:hypothetical protein